MNLTPTQAQAALLRRGLTHLLAHPDHMLESDLRHVVWVLAQCATRSLAEEGTASGTLDLAEMKAASDLAQAANPPPEYITIRQACERYAIPRSTLGWHVRKGNIAAHRADKRTWLVDHRSLVTWLLTTGRSE